ncbi:hypothetical protein [Thalassotalea fusca]
MEQVLEHNEVTSLFKSVIVSLQELINYQGITPKIHFEVEGCFVPLISPRGAVSFEGVNRRLKHLGIDGKIIPEYWRNQWEFVSAFHGQTPLKEAQNIATLIKRLPELFKQENIGELLIRPVVWSGDKGKLAPKCHSIFTQDNRAVHIPNAIQMNISVWDDRTNENLLVSEEFGAHLQQILMQRSRDCSLLFLPEEDAFARFSLKTQYGLARELCSPSDISGGHQGSIALYKQWGKHNQPMGIKTLLVNTNNDILLSQQDWHSTTRIEHRLGASSVFYNAYSNVIFALLCVIEALNESANKVNVDTEICAEKFMLPSSLYDTTVGVHCAKGDTEECENHLGAISLFMQNSWFIKSIDEALAHHSEIAPQLRNDNTQQRCHGINSMLLDTVKASKLSIGEQVHQGILAPYLPATIITSR